MSKFIKALGTRKVKEFRQTDIVTFTLFAFILLQYFFTTWH